MPTYEYRCTSCGEHLEVVQAFSDHPLTDCPACGQRLKKVFHSVGIAFKGSGFYKNDSRATVSTSSSSSTSSGATSSGSSSESSGGSSESSGASGSTDKATGSNGDGGSSKPSDKPASTSGAGAKSA